MPEPIRDVSHHVLKACANKGPDAFYPRVDAANLEIDRPNLDAALDRLRLGGFIEIADWNLQKGQGYRVTDAGRAAAVRPELLNRPAPPPVQDIEVRVTRGSSDQAEEIRQSVLNPPPAIETRILVAINVAVYVIICGFNLQNGKTMADVIDGRLVQPGALVPLTFFGLNQWWQLFTHSFEHASPMHIGMNMYCLFTLGTVLEGRWGRVRFLILYFGSGLIAGVAFLLTSKNPMTGAVGASGAIAGLLTSLAVWAWMNRRYLPPQFVEAHFRMVGINLIILVGIGFMIPNVSNAGHVGGAIGGAILSVPLTWLGPRLPWRHRVMGVLSLLAIGVLCLIALDMAPKPEIQLGPQRLRIEK
jgi:membrane associated rhomboid family serine protease